MVTMGKLKNDAHEMFCQEYLVDFNAKQAYLKVKPKVKERTAEVNSHKLLRNTEIQQRLAELREKRIKRIQSRADRILAECDNLSMIRPGKIFEKDGITVKNIHDIPDEVQSAISGVEVVEFDDKIEYVCEDCGAVTRRKTPGYIKKVKFWNKNKAIENLGRHEELWTDKIKLSDISGLADKLNGARERTGQADS